MMPPRKARSKRNAGPDMPGMGQRSIASLSLCSRAVRIVVIDWADEICPLFPSVLYCLKYPTMTSWPTTSPDTSMYPRLKTKRTGFSEKYPSSLPAVTSTDRAFASDSTFVTIPCT